MKLSVNKYIDQEINAIKNIPNDGVLDKVLDISFENDHKKNGKVIGSGMGKAGHIGMNISTTLSSTGTPSAFIHPSEAQHGDLGLIQKNDVLLLISNSGKTREILEFNLLANKLFNEIPLISLTGNNQSPLAKVSNECLFTGNPKEICPLGLTPTTSTTVMTVVGDLLVIGMIGVVEQNIIIILSSIFSYFSLSYFYQMWNNLSINTSFSNIIEIDRLLKEELTLEEE